jgi:hypothetical protein
VGAITPITPIEAQSNSDVVKRLPPLNQRMSRMINLAPGIQPRNFGKQPSTKAANKLVDAIREPACPTIYFHAVKLHTTGNSLRKHWGFTTKPVSSAEMNTSVQEGSDPMQKLVTFGSVRLSLGIPDDNEQYHIRFIYPTDETRVAGFEGGFVYYSGPWNGLTNETKVVGANTMDATGETKANSFAMQLTKYDAGKPSVYGDLTGSMKDYMVEVGIELQQFQSSTLSGIAVEQWAWLAPTQARAIAKNVEDGVRVTDGSFIFQLPSRIKEGPPVYCLYSMTMRRLLKDPPHQYSKESRMHPDHVQKIASAYTAEYSPPPPTNETPLRFLLLLGGSGAGKSTLLSYLEARGMDRQNYVYSGLDEMLVFVPEYTLAVHDPTVGYMTGADACYGDCISIASEVNKISKSNHLNLIVEDTGKRLQQTLNFIKDIGGTCDSRGRRRAVTVALVDNDPETAISRARGRFQREGRFSAPEYVRDSFRGVFDNYCQLKKMAAAGDIAVDSFIYCDNSQRGESKVDATTQLAPSTAHSSLSLVTPFRLCIVQFVIHFVSTPFVIPFVFSTPFVIHFVSPSAQVWLEQHKGDRPPIVSSDQFCTESIMYRPHTHLLQQLLCNGGHAEVRRAYNELIAGMMEERTTS